MVRRLKRRIYEHKLHKKVGRTEAQIKAAERDGRFCLFCKHIRGALRLASEVHHIFGRSRSDAEETCIHLCYKCHRWHHQTNDPSTRAIIGLMERLYHYDYSPYAQFIKEVQAN